MSTVSVNTSGSQLSVVGTEHTLATITAAGVYQLFVDVSVMADGTTGDEVQIREYMKGASGDTERLLKVYMIYGKQTEAMFITPPRMSAASIKYTLLQSAGSARTYVWNVQQA